MVPAAAPQPIGRDDATHTGGAGDRTGAPQPALDALVTHVAAGLMSVSADRLPEALEWILRTLTEFFGMDTSFLRRNDLDRDVTVLAAEWPHREHIPDPDPLGEVPFGVDPVFDATRDLKEPFVIRPTNSPDTYQQRVEEGSGVGEVSMAMVPLIRVTTTVGVLGFITFGDRPWSTAETNALQAVAALIVQLESRIDAEERLQYQAYHDELTGLPNRRAFLEELDRRRQQIDERALTLLFCDLDRFKVINDSMGHTAGDRVLVIVAERIRAALGASDFAARLGGDEFVVLLDNLQGEAEALMMADTLVEVVSRPMHVNGHHITRTVSIGVSVDREPLNHDDPLAQADAALSRSKSRGGNQAILFDKVLQASAQQQSDTELQLRDAIDTGGLLLYYQPEFNLHTGEVLAVEALVRWDHPTRGILAAGSFVKVAEETGMIVDLGKWVLGEACRQMADWRRRYPQLRLTMRVNMSPAQLAAGNVVSIVAEHLRVNHLPGRLLCLEITEHAVVQDIEQALTTLHALKALGVSLAIDDFGTGYSSMTQLKRLPVDVLKIDQAFVAGLGTDDGDRAIVDATVRLARSFGLDVVAEGVELVGTVHELIGLGCYRAQGYLLSHPKPAAEVEPYLVGGIDPPASQAADHPRREHIPSGAPGPGAAGTGRRLATSAVID